MLKNVQKCSNQETKLRISNDQATNKKFILQEG